MSQLPFVPIRKKKKKFFGDTSLFSLRNFVRNSKAKKAIGDNINFRFGDKRQKLQNMKDGKGNIKENKLSRYSKLRAARTNGEAETKLL